MEYNEPSVDHLRILKKYFKLSSFKKEQWLIIRGIIYNKKDCCVIASTGFGKSLIYQFPPIFMNKLAVVISPLCALMQDQVYSLKAKGIKAVFFGSQQTDKSLRMVDYNVAYITPEFLLGNGKYLLRESMHKIMLFAIDEAHVIDQWSDFRSVYSNLGVIRESFPKIPIVALTATAPQYVQNIITSSLRLRDDFIFVKTALDRSNLEFSIRPKRNGNYVKDVLPLLKNIKEGSAIVYCLSRKITEHIALEFCLEGIECRPYHSKLSIEFRKKVVQDFRSNKLRFVICTIAYGMGIDKGDVRLVVHYGVSKSLEAYYQEAGRAGRDGKPSQCILFYESGDFRVLRGFIKLNKKSSEEKKMHMNQLLVRVSQFIKSKQCRRLELLNYLGTTEEELKKITIRSNCCDNCKYDLLYNIPPQLQYHEVENDGTVDFTEDSKKVLKFVKKNLIRVEVVKTLIIFKYDESVLGEEKSRQWWNNVILLLIDKNLLHISGDTLTLDESAEKVLETKESKLRLEPSEQLLSFFDKNENIEFFWNNGKIASKVKVLQITASQINSDDLFDESDDDDDESLLAVCDEEEHKNLSICKLELDKDSNSDDSEEFLKEIDNLERGDSADLLKEIDFLEQQDSRDQLEISNLELVSLDVDDDEEVSFDFTKRNREDDDELDREHLHKVLKR